MQMGSRGMTTGSNSFSFEAGWDKPAATVGGDAAFRIRIAAPALPATQRRVPTDVAFVLDRSGSMSGEKIVLAKQAVDEACKHLRDEDRAALVVFDNEIDLLQAIEPATGRVKTSIRMALVGVDARGGTNLSGGWFAGCKELDPNSGVNQAFAGPRVRRAILLTDGQANDGICDPRELGRHANTLRQLGVSTTTLGLGEGFDEFLLSAMAEAGGGNFQYLRGASDLREFFEKELQELLSVMALGMKVTVTCPEGVHARPVSAFPAERTANVWTMDIGEVPAGETLDIIFETRVKPGFSASEATFGVEVSWSDPAADTRRAETLALAPLAVGSQAAVDAMPQSDEIAAVVALQRAMRDKKKALEADRVGDRDGAIMYARKISFDLSAAPPSPEVMASRIDADFMFDALSSPMGMSEEDRKDQMWSVAQAKRNRGDRRARQERGRSQEERDEEFRRMFGRNPDGSDDTNS
jgi:Ca-activated chloride channel family protein